MSIKQFLATFPEYRVSYAQLSFARYLESRGMRFLVDFGFENAEGIAWDKLEDEPYDYPVGHA